VSYDQLLDAFWKIHDPTQVNRQGPDFGSQYRSAIFTYSPTQTAEAIASRDREQAKFGKPIATQIVPAPTFYPAEDYHQKYFERNGVACQVSL
jgi:peptide-methionine (S)-S-oxide reductase